MQFNILLPLFRGLSTGGSLIVAIGAQNAFVIRQGLQRKHLFVTALLCSLIDAGLIVAGVMGFGHLVSNYPVLIRLTKYFAITFLIAYGVLSLKSAFRSRSLSGSEKLETSSLKATILMILGFSLLNPHVYLDTVILLGSVASQQPSEDKFFFALGAISASFIWFFSITYGSWLLAPILSRSSAWRVIDALIAVTLWGIAAQLVAS